MSFAEYMRRCHYHRLYMEAAFSIPADGKPFEEWLALVTEKAQREPSPNGMWMYREVWMGIRHPFIPEHERPRKKKWGGGRP